MSELFPEEKKTPPMTEEQKKLYEIIAQTPNINLDDLSEK